MMGAKMVKCKNILRNQAQMTMVPKIGMCLSYAMPRETSPPTPHPQLFIDFGKTETHIWIEF